MEGINQECGSDFSVNMRLGLKTFVKGFGQASLTVEGEIGRTVEEGVEIVELLGSYVYAERVFGGIGSESKRSCTYTDFGRRWDERSGYCRECDQGCITRLQQGKQPTCAVNPATISDAVGALFSLL